MIRPQRLVHLLQGLEIGGLEMIVVHLLEALDPSRYRIQVVCYDQLGPLAHRLGLCGIPSCLLKRRTGVDVSYIFRLAHHLAAARPDILHLHNPTAFFYGTLAGRVAQVPTIIYTEHGRDLASSKYNKILHRVLGRLVDQVAAVSESGRHLLEREGVPAGRILTLHNGIDARRFMAPADNRGVRAHLGFKEDQPLIGIVARLDPVKNHASLLRAMRRVIDTYPDATLLVIGDGPLRKDLDGLAAGLGLGRGIRFLGMRDDVPELLGALDVLVLCSLSEGLSVSLIEGCAAGKPAVATVVGGNAEIVEHGRTGLLVSLGDENTLAGAIIDLLDDPQRASSLGQAARRKFLAEFTLERMVSRYVEIYERCSAPSLP